MRMKVILQAEAKEAIGTSTGLIMCFAAMSGGPLNCDGQCLSRTNITPKKDITIDNLDIRNNSDTKKWWPDMESNMTPTSKSPQSDVDTIVQIPYPDADTHKAPESYNPSLERANKPPRTPHDDIVSYDNDFFFCGAVLSDTAEEVLEENSQLRKNTYENPITVNINQEHTKPFRTPHEDLVVYDQDFFFCGAELTGAASNNRDEDDYYHPTINARETSEQFNPNQKHIKRDRIPHEDLVVYEEEGFFARANPADSAVNSPDDNYKPKNRPIK